MTESFSYPSLPVPPLARLRRNFPADHIEDSRADVRERLLQSGLAAKVKPGARIAISAGSRGMGGLLGLLAGVADAVRSVGGEPFIVPAMGSHGGATASGQERILNLLGVDDRTVPAPIRATMDTVDYGKSSNGAAAHLDAIAAGADGIIVLGRTKTHPESDEGLASGLLKMLVVGLGKQRGAQEAHNHELWASVRCVPEVTMAKAPILFGISVVENAYRQPIIVEVVPPAYGAFLDADQRLLKAAKPHVAKLPFDHLDLLIVDEVGKTISGSGMDLNVIGRYRATGKGPRQPDIRRIVALSLTAPSLGNGLGVGLADFTTRRFMEQFDPAATYINLLTATEPGGTTREGPMPLALESDRQAIEVGLYSALPGDAPRICRIRNTAELTEMWISEPLVEEALREVGATIEEAARPLPFDGRGNLW